jgi:hypothetical protein
MIEQLVALLARAAVPADHRELADALWLAPYLPPPMLTDVGPIEPASTLERAQAPVSDQVVPLAPRPAQRLASQSKPVISVAERADLYTVFATPGTAGNLTATRVRVPAAEALPGALEITRALRPLSRRFPSSRLFLIDEDATAHRIASGGPVTPVFRPQPERWFDAAVVSRRQTLWSSGHR